MSLEESIKELKDQIEEKKKEEAEEETAEEVAEEQEQEEKKEEKSEEKKEEETEKKDEKEEEEKPDAAAFQRMRREKAAAEKKAQEAEAKRLEAETKLAEKKEEKEEKPEIIPELEEMFYDHRKAKAEREFQNLEAKFKQSNPDYDAVASEYTMALAQSIKIQNPRMSNMEIAEKTKETILLKAAKYLNEGYDAVEELYHEAKELGFTGKSSKQDEGKEEKEIKPDMKKVAENRKRSTGMASSTGESKGMLTQQAASELTIAEFAKLPQEEKQRILYPR